MSLSVATTLFPSVLRQPPKAINGVEVCIERRDLADLAAALHHHEPSAERV
jgi:hypothetical protein